MSKCQEDEKLRWMDGDGQQYALAQERQKSKEREEKLRDSTLKRGWGAPCLAVLSLPLVLVEVELLF